MAFVFAPSLYSPVSLMPFRLCDSTWSIDDPPMLVTWSAYATTKNIAARRAIRHNHVLGYFAKEKDSMWRGPRGVQRIVPFTLAFTLWPVYQRIDTIFGVGGMEEEGKGGSWNRTKKWGLLLTSTGNWPRDCPEYNAFDSPSIGRGWGFALWSAAFGPVMLSEDEIGIIALTPLHGPRFAQDGGSIAWDLQTNDKFGLIWSSQRASDSTHAGSYFQIDL
jgi:hypothetical protein